MHPFAGVCVCLTLFLRMIRTKHRVLLSNSDRWSVGQIASALGVSSAAATKAVVRLERKGLVKRSENTIDRRRVDVSLTRTGTKNARPDRLFLEGDRSD